MALTVFAYLGLGGGQPDRFAQRVEGSAAAPPLSARGPSAGICDVGNILCCRNATARCIAFRTSIAAIVTGRAGLVSMLPQPYVRPSVEWCGPHVDAYSMIG